MPNYKHHCPNCGDGVPAERWNLGYKYCKKDECFEQLGRKKGVTMFDRPPDPDTVDISPYDLDDVADLYGEGE
jgi:hypothetical protein